MHGLSTAAALARRLGANGGGSGVVLLERSRLGAGASGIAGGIVRGYYRSPAIMELVLLSVTPAEVKRAVTASGAAPKAQVARAMQALLDLPALPSSSHVADALALAFTGLSRARGHGVR